MAAVSIVNYAGRIFDKPVEPNKDGLLAVINYTGSGSNYLSSKKQVGITQAFSAQFNNQGDKFVISDNKGILVVYLSANRYAYILKDSKPTKCLAFTASDEVLLSQHTTMSIHTLNGKVEAEMKGHKLPISRFEINTMHNFILS